MKLRRMDIVFVSLVVMLVVVVIAQFLDNRKLKFQIEMHSENIQALEEERADLNADFTSLQNDSELEILKLMNDLELEEDRYLLLEESFDSIEVLLHEVEETVLPYVAAQPFLDQHGLSADDLILNFKANQDEIIGHEGVLGGTMQFIQVWVLNERWVFARFEDGHYGGYGIYEYAINGDDIQWSRVVEATDK